MTDASWIGLGAFVGTLILFALTVMRVGKSIRSAATFFHSSGARQNLVSLIAANITIGTGISYLLVGGQQNGILMAVVPLGIVAGYFGLEQLARGGVSEEIANHRNFFSGVGALIVREGGGRGGRFSWMVLAPLMTVFLLVFAYELFVSSQLIAGLVFATGSPLVEAAIACILFVASLSYSLYGGINAVFRTDQIQLVGIVLFVGVLTTGVLAFEEPLPSRGWISSDSHVVASVAVAAVAAVATQLYSLINWYMISNLRESGTRRRVLRGSAIVTGALLIPVVLAGAISSVDWSEGLSTGVTSLFAPLHDSVPGALVLAVIVAGATCVVVSTTDSLLVSLTMFAYDELLLHDSQSESNGRAAVRKARRVMAGLFLMGFVALSLMYYFRPNIFYLLLAIGTGAAVFAPLIVLVGFLSKREGGLAAISAGALWMFTGLFLLAVPVGLWCSVAHPPAVPYVSLAFMLLAVVAAFSIAAGAMRDVT